MFTRGNSALAASSPSSASFSRREVLRLAPAVAIGLCVPSATPALAAGNKHEKQCLARDKIVENNIKTFRHADFHVFNNQRWDQLYLSHSRDVVVHWPDGRTTVGIDAHIEDLKALFVWAPDTQVFEHTILFGGGDAAQFTCSVGFFGGTFTEPMPIGGGQTIQPTGKSYRIRFSTTAHWIPDGVFDEEYLLWDNQELGRQLGLL